MKQLTFGGLDCLYSLALVTVTAHLSRPKSIILLSLSLFLFLLFIIIVTDSDCNRGGTVFTGVCLSVCLFFCTTSKNRCSLITNLTQKSSTEIPRNSFILGQSLKIKVTRHKKQCRRRFLLSRECALLLVSLLQSFILCI